MTKILNMDEVQAPEVAVMMDGVKHIKKELTTREFLKISQKAEAAEKKADQMTMAEFVNELVETILIAFPSMDRDVLLDKPLDYLYRIVEFSRDPGQEIGEVAKEEGNESEAS